VATPEQAQEVHEFIRDVISEIYDEEVSHSMSVLYGGSIKPSNFLKLIVQPDIDGGLVGGASLNEQFLELGKIMCQVCE